MDCDHARHWLAFARPAELEAADLAELDDHLAACAECGTLASADRQADDVLSRAMQAVPVPDGFRAHLTTRLAAARGAWWRRTLLHASAACVTVMLAASLLHAVTRPRLDLTASAEVANVQAGLWKSILQGKEDANALLRALGAPPAAPSDFDYRLLIWVKRTDSHGLRSVPTLLFIRGQAYAEVVLVREGEVKNLRGLAEHVGEDSGTAVTVLSVPDHSGWFYVITTYGKPASFFKRNDPPVGAA